MSQTPILHGIPRDSPYTTPAGPTSTLRTSLNALQDSPPSYGSTDTSDTLVAEDLTVSVDRATTPQVSVHGYSAGSPRSAALTARGESTEPPRRSFCSKLSIFQGQLISFFISSFFLSLVVAWASIVRLSVELPKWLRPSKPVHFPWNDTKQHKKEKVVKEVQHYARAVGFDILDEEVETADGYYLRMHRIVGPGNDQSTRAKGGFPVLILHGLFQSSGSFITSEERSLAFWLSKHAGYQVFLGNTRCVFGMGHKYFSKMDPRFWDWTIRELAMYDFPAMVDYVRDVTGYDKIAFIGHSQGNSLAFISLSTGLCPEVGAKLSCFIALAPAVFAGPLIKGSPFALLNKMEWRTWRRVFGVLDFIPLMRWSYDHVHPVIFATMGYTMFAYLFEWTDTNWLKRRKTKMFRFTPTPVSSRSVFWWCGKGGFAQRGCAMDTTLPQWFDERFPPLAVYHGGRDFLVLAEALLERIRKREPHVRLLRTERIDVFEHCDFYWAADAVEWCFSSFVEDIEKTRPDQRDIDAMT